MFQVALVQCAYPEACEAYGEAPQILHFLVQGPLAPYSMEPETRWPGRL